MPGPEGVAAAFVVVIALVAVAVIGGGLGGATAAPSASPDSTGSAAAPQPSRLVDRAIADLLVIVNQQLIEAGDQLADEVERATGRTTEIAGLVREVNATARYGADALPALGSTAEARDLIQRLAPLYDELRAIADETLRASMNNAAAYELGATGLIAVIAEIPTFQLELQAIRDEVVVASVPPASLPPSEVPSDPPPSDVPTPEPSAPPSDDPSRSPGRPIGPSQVINGGFEDGTATAWRLVVADGASVTLTDERSDPATGAISARVDLGTATVAYSGVSLEQMGMRLQAGASYTISLALRAEVPRDVRLRVASSDGDAYLTRIAAAGPTWMVVSFTFLAPANDDEAVIQIELGRSDATTWIDDVVLGPSIEP